MRGHQACRQPVSGGIVYIKYCICKIHHLVLYAMTTTDGLNIILIFLCMSTETDRLPTGMVGMHRTSFAHMDGGEAPS